MKEYEYGIALRSQPSVAHRWDMTEAEAREWLRSWKEDLAPEFKDLRFMMIRRPVGDWEPYE